MSRLNLKDCEQALKQNMININDYKIFKSYIKNESASFLSSVNINSKNKKSRTNIQKKLDEIRQKYNIGKNLDPLLYANLFVPKIINGEDNYNDEEFINIASEAMYCCKPEDMANYLSVRCNIKKSVYYWKLSEFIVYKDYYKRLGLWNQIEEIIKFAEKEKLKVVQNNNITGKFTPVDDDKVLTTNIAVIKDAITKSKVINTETQTNFKEIGLSEQKAKILRMPVFIQTGSSNTFVPYHQQKVS